MLIKNGKLAAQDRAYVPNGEPLPDGKITVTLQRYKDDAKIIDARNSAVGVRLEPGDDPNDLAESLERLDLIEVSFPRYADGRGYSQAQLLRRRLGYKGELRAVGDVLRDQLLYMHRCGFDTFELANSDQAGAETALAEFEHFYQTGADNALTVFQLRHQRES